MLIASAILGRFSIAFSVRKIPFVEPETALRIINPFSSRVLRERLMAALSLPTRLAMSLWLCPSLINRFCNIANWAWLSGRCSSRSGLYDNDALQFCVNKLGIDRLVFSADWPYVPMTDANAFVDNAPLSDTDKDKFAHLTAEKLLHITV